MQRSNLSQNFNDIIKNNFVLEICKPQFIKIEKANLYIYTLFRHSYVITSHFSITTAEKK